MTKKVVSALTTLVRKVVALVTFNRACAAAARSSCSKVVCIKSAKKARKPSTKARTTSAKSRK